MRADDRVRPAHMIDAADTISTFMAGRKREDLDSDRMLLFAVVHAIPALLLKLRSLSALFHN
jgi:uncharacterized protein with HEPN domain